MFKREPIIAAGNTLGIEEYTLFEESLITDRGKAWDLISPLIIKTEACPHTKRAMISREGRKVMLVFHDYFLGPNNVDHIQKQA